MVTYKLKRLSIFLWIAILSVAVNLAPAMAGSGIVLVKSTGTVEIKGLQPDSWKPVASGVVLSFGDVIRTGPQSKAEISFDGGTIGVQENTVLEIPSRFQQLQVSEGSEKLKNVFIMKGGSLFKIFKNRMQNGFEVTTPSIIAGVKGTTFTVSEEEGNKGVTVEEGTVVVTNRRYPAETMEITGGHFIMLKDQHLESRGEIRRDIQREIRKENSPGSDGRKKDRSRQQERLTDLRQEIQDRSGAGGLGVGQTGNLPPGLGGTSPGNAVGQSVGNHGNGNGGNGNGNNGNHGNGNNGNGNGGNN